MRDSPTNTLGGVSNTSHSTASYDLPIDEFIRKAHDIECLYIAACEFEAEGKLEIATALYEKVYSEGLAAQATLYEALRKCPILPILAYDNEIGEFLSPLNHLMQQLVESYLPSLAITQIHG